MILGIEIGGTKLQLGVATRSKASEPLVALERFSVDRECGAQGILEQIKAAAPDLIKQHGVEAVGIGFGGPVNLALKSTITSHQVDGWNDFPLGDWCHKNLGLVPELGNDCNAAALAEATLGAGRDVRRMFYVTIGTGIGGGLVVDGRIDGDSRPAIAEIGHLRPGIEALKSGDTVEAVASGLGIENRMRLCLPATANGATAEVVTLMRMRDSGRLTAQSIGIEASQGNRLAESVLDEAARTLGWAMAQVVTLSAPERIVIGGGVALMGEPLFQKLRYYTQQYVFPPLADSVTLMPAALGEETVVHGAIQLVRVAEADR